MKKAKNSDQRVAVMGFHEGTAGQVAEWFERATGLSIEFYFIEDKEVPRIDARAENKKRVSQRMEYPTEDGYKGRPFFARMDWPELLKEKGISKVLVMLHENHERQAALKKCAQYGFEVVSAIHPSAIILEQAAIEPGVWIAAGAIVGFKAEVKAGAFMNTGSQIDHHAILESCSQIDPGVVCAGHVTVRELARVHTNATIINRITIGRGAIVGAGTVVIRDVPDGVTVAGVPAREIKKK